MVAIILVILGLAALVVAHALGLTTMSVSNSVTIGGVAMAESATVEAETVVSAQCNQPSATSEPAQTATITVLSTPNQMHMDDVGHDIEVDDRVDIYWTDSNDVHRVCYGCAVTVVSGQTVSFTTGATTGPGSALPTVGTDIVVARSSSHPCLVTGSNAVAIVVSCDSECTVMFATSAPADKLTVHLLAGQIYVNRFEAGNPLAAAAITQVYVSHTNIAGQEIVHVNVLTN